MPGIRNVIFRGVRLADWVAETLPSCGGFLPLRGPFSALEKLRAGQTNGAVLSESQDIGPCPAGSITEQSRLGQNDHQPWPVFWTMQRSARLTGRIRLWRDDAERYCIEGNYHLKGRRRLSEDHLLAHMLPGPERRLPGAWTSIASNWGDGRNYYHWITDNLTRLWVREHLPEATRILLPGSNASYIRETLEMLGLEGLCESPNENHLMVERFYFCSPTAMTGVWNPLGFTWLRERFSRFFGVPRSGAPVFLTRRGSTRIPEALDAIESRFQRAGFEIIDCGKLSVRDQIHTVSTAPAVAGIHGAAMTNLLWAPEGTPVLEVFEPEYLNACYEQIAFHGRLDYTPHLLENSKSMDGLENWLRRFIHQADAYAKP